MNGMDTEAKELFQRAESLLSFMANHHADNLPDDIVHDLLFTSNRMLEYMRPKQPVVEKLESEPKTATGKGK